MRILAVTPLYPPASLVGAWITTHEFLRDLVARGHSVDVVQTLNRQRPYVHEGVHVHSGRSELRRLGDDADVIISHAGDDGSAARFAADRGIPSVRMAHGRISDPVILEGAALVVFNSANLAASTGYTGPSIVAHPPIDPDRYRVTAHGDRIGIVNLADSKGGAVAWAMARALDGHRFLAVRGGYGRQELRTAYPNVETMPPTEDMRTVYRHLRILLAPSDDETFGRVAVEAAFSGIPVISTPNPGIIEALGDAPTYVDKADRGGWVREIRRLDHPAAWSHASTAIATAAAKRLDPRISLDRFADAITSL